MEGAGDIYGRAAASLPGDARTGEISEDELRYLKEIGVVEGHDTKSSKSKREGNHDGEGEQAKKEEVGRVQILEEELKKLKGRVERMEEENKLIKDLIKKIMEDNKYLLNNINYLNKKFSTDMGTLVTMMMGMRGALQTEKKGKVRKSNGGEIKDPEGESDDEKKKGEREVDSEGDIIMGEGKKKTKKRGKTLIFKFKEEDKMMKNYERMEEKGGMEEMIGVEYEEKEGEKIYYLKMEYKKPKKIIIENMEGGEYIDKTKRGSAEREIVM